MCRQVLRFKISINASIKFKAPGTVFDNDQPGFTSFFYFFFRNIKSKISDNYYSYYSYYYYLIKKSIIINYLNS